MKKRPGIVGVIIVVIILFVLIGAIAVPILIVGNWLGGGLDKATGAVGAAYASSECLTPLYPPVRDEGKLAKAIDKYIVDLVPSSPFVGMGKDFVDAGKRYGLNPAWIVNIARKESSFGTRIPPGSNNAYGRTATTDQPHVIVNGRRWYKYGSFLASIDGQAEFLKRRYIDQGLVTIKDITNVYAPPSENNTSGYIDQMNQWIGTVMVLAGDGMACPTETPARLNVVRIDTRWLG